MSYKIILDSCGELPKELQNDPRFERVPLGLEVGDYSILVTKAILDFIIVIVICNHIT